MIPFNFKKALFRGKCYGSSKGSITIKTPIILFGQNGVLLCSFKTFTLLFWFTDSFKLFGYNSVFFVTTSKFIVNDKSITFAGGAISFRNFNISIKAYVIGGHTFIVPYLRCNELLTHSGRVPCLRLSDVS